MSQGFIGSGTLSHLCGLYLQQTIKSKWTFVPYRGAAPAIQDLVGGQVDLMCLAPSGSSLPLARSGKVRAYAIMSPTRLPVGAGDPDRRRGRPAGLPSVVLAGVLGAEGHAEGHRRRSSTRRWSRRSRIDGVRAKLTELGQIIPPREQQTPEALAALRRAEADKWWPIIKAAGIKPDQ